MEENKSRRGFLSLAFGTAIAAASSGAIAAVLEACSSSGNPVDSQAVNLPTIQGTLSGQEVTVSIGSSSALASVGGAALVQYSGGALLAAHTGTNTFTALTSICTHQGCTVSEYDSGSKHFVCPCHGSQYTTSGQVAQGPAPSSLTAYTVSFANNILTVTL